MPQRISQGSASAALHNSMKSDRLISLRRFSQCATAPWLISSFSAKASCVTPNSLMWAFSLRPQPIQSMRLR